MLDPRTKSSRSRTAHPSRSTLHCSNPQGSAAYNCSPSTRLSIPPCIHWLSDCIHLSSGTSTTRYMSVDPSTQTSSWYIGQLLHRTSSGIHRGTHWPQASATSSVAGSRMISFVTSFDPMDYDEGNNNSGSWKTRDELTSESYGSARNGGMEKTAAK